MAIRAVAALGPRTSEYTPIDLDWVMAHLPYIISARLQRTSPHAIGRLAVEMPDLRDAARTACDMPEYDYPDHLAIADYIVGLGRDYAQYVDVKGVGRSQILMTAWDDATDDAEISDRAAGTYDLVYALNELNFFDGAITAEEYANARMLDRFLTVAAR